MILTQQKLSLIFFLQLSITVGLTTGCGSIAGNPKKPTTPPPTQEITPVDPDPLDPQNPANQVTIAKMKLPTISFELGDLTSEDQVSAFALRDRPDQFDQNEDFKADDTVITGWSSRLEKIIDNMNMMTLAVNNALENEASEVTTQKIKLKKKGHERRISATIDKYDEGGNIRFEASVCLGGRLAGYLTWNADQSKVVYTRDLSSKAKNTDDDIPLMTQLTIEKSEVGTRYNLKTSGSWVANQPAQSDGNLFVEATETLRRNDGMIDIKYVADYFSTRPTDDKFEGDSYLVGRLHTTNLKGKSGKNRSQKEFVAYFKGSSQDTCRNGFDENLASIWLPKANEPRFCLGRPLANNRFKTLASFYETLTSLKPIGVLSRQTLSVPTFKDGLKCEE